MNDVRRTEVANELSIIFCDLDTAHRNGNRERCCTLLERAIPLKRELLEFELAELRERYTRGM